MVKRGKVARRGARGDRNGIAPYAAKGKTPPIEPKNSESFYLSLDRNSRNSFLKHSSFKICEHEFYKSRYSPPGPFLVHWEKIVTLYYFFL